MLRYQTRKNFAFWAIFLLIGIIISGNLSAFAEPIVVTKVSMKETSPLKQFKSGVKAGDIQCKDDHQLVIKTKNNIPICVKPSSVPKLVLLGYAKMLTDVDTGQDESSTKTVTLDDNEKTITLKEGQSFLLKLGENFDWTIDIDNQTVVSRQMNIMVIKGAQGIYNAHHAGTATLTGVGDPLCLHAESPCKIHSILFTLKIIVTSATDQTNSSLSITTDKDQYGIGEEVSITITNLGDNRIFPNGWGYSIVDINGNHFAPNGVLRMMLVALPPGNSTHWTWDQIDANGIQVKPGKYRVVGMYTEEDTEKSVSNFKEIEIKKGSNDDISMHVAPVHDYDSLIKALDEKAVKHEFVEQLEDSSFSVPTKEISINGQNVQVFEFSSATAAQDAASTVSEDGTQIGNSIIRWIDIPHFYTQDKIIVLYVGHDNDTLSLLESLLDKQFAGM